MTRNQFQFLSCPLAIALLVLITGAVPAHAGIPATVGRLISSPVGAGRDDPTKKLVSTVMIFGVPGHAYALAAESRVYPSPDANAFTNEIEIINHVPDRYRATWITSDPGMGLALLELQSDEWTRSLPLPTVAEGLQEGLAADILAVDGATGNMINGADGALLSLESDRHAIPELSAAYEVLGAVIGSSAVGGYVQSNQFEWEGVVSNQFLKLQPGQTTGLQYWDPSSTDPEGHLVVIPAKAAVAWIKQVLAGAERPAYSVTAVDRLQGVARWTSGSLLFTESCPPTNASVHAVVGSFPIGGADGAGVGGLITTGHACKIGIGLSSTPTSVFGVASEQAWHDRVVAALTQYPGLSAEVWYLAGKDAISARPERRTIGSLEEFFRDLGRGGYETATLYFKKGETVPGIDPTLAPLRKAASAVVLAVTHWLASPTMITSDSTLALSRQVYFEAVALESEDYSVVGVADLDYLLDRNGPYKEAWEIIEMFGAGVPMQIHISLEALRVERAKAGGH